MYQNNQLKSLVEELKSRLHQRPSMRVRFRMPLPKEATRELLLEAVYAEVLFCEQKFINSEILMAQVDAIAGWLIGETSKFGLLLCGICGNGKTTFVRAIQQLINAIQLPVYRDDPKEKYGMRICDARELALLCRTKPEEFQKICELRMLAIDDLGTEAYEVSDYSNRMNPMLELLLKRYDKRLFTIVTTNLTPEQLREKYGERLADRFNEMMHKEVFKNHSYRTPQS